jgi:hypothetical protein
MGIDTRFQPMLGHDGHYKFCEYEQILLIRRQVISTSLKNYHPQYLEIVMILFVPALTVCAPLQAPSTVKVRGGVVRVDSEPQAKS